MIKALKHAWHWLRCHFWNRYHIINISGEDDYRWGWLDTDHRMFLACFKLLTEFVENEAPEGYGVDETVESYGNPQDPDERAMIEAQIARHKEVRAIYMWWILTRPSEHKEHAAAVERLPRSEPDDGLIFYDSPEFAVWCDEDTRLEQKDEEMLARLMVVRRSLWT